jgi:hypothetical protein
MPVYFFQTTLKVRHQGLAIKTSVTRGARAPDELTARRIILNQFFARGFQVVRLDRVREPEPETVGEPWA